MSVKHLMIFSVVGVWLLAASCKGREFDNRATEQSAGKGEPESSLPDSVRDPKPYSN
jgi:hypothetical protein